MAQFVTLITRFAPLQLALTVALDVKVAEETGRAALADPLNAAWAIPGANTSTAAAARTAATRPNAGVCAASAVLRLLRKVSGFLSGPVVHPILTAFMR